MDMIIIIIIIKQNYSMKIKEIMKEEEEIF